MTAIVWSKNGCPYCTQAKMLLDNYGIKYEERNLSTGNWTKEQLLEAVPDARTVPQIFMHNEYVGDFVALKSYIEEHDMWRND